MSIIQKDPLWLQKATAKLGIKEIVGSKHNPTILGWLKLLGAWWSNDEEAWCGTFVAICLKEANLPIIKTWYRAKDWATYGFKTTPRLGALLVFGRTGGGHVGWYMGQAMRRVGGLMVLCYRVRGGNQGNAVCDTWIVADRLIACRWPSGVALTAGVIELSDNGEAMSDNEA
jgi:uncharacterized protein (TIGR02594 family)